MLAEAQITVTSSATKLAARDADGQTVSIENKGSASIFVGDANVTTGTGFEVAASGTYSIDLQADEELWAIVASTSCLVQVLRSRVS